MTTPLLDLERISEEVIGYPVTVAADDIPTEPGIRELKAHLSDYAGRALYRDEPVFVKRNGKRALALVPAEWAERMLAERAKDES